MKAFLMFKDRDLDLQHPMPPNAADLVQDLELETLLGAMAAGDDFIHEVCKVAILTSVRCKVDEIEYRQRAMVDSLRNPGTVREIYDLAGEAITREKKSFFGLYRDSPETVLSRSVSVLTMFVEVLRKLRAVTESSRGGFRSDAFQNFFEMLQRELSDDYFDEVAHHLGRLKFPEGVLVSSRLGEGNKGVGYVLRELPDDDRIWPLKLLPRRREGYTINLHPRDEAGGRALTELRNRGLGLAARALGQSVDHILSFFHMLRAEVGFYIGGVNLHERLSGLGMKTVIPSACPITDLRFSCVGLFDVCLAISMKKAVVGNDIVADRKRLFVITGANQGGKSTFMRSAGLAQLMMQSGLFVGAEEFEANIVRGVFTHYKREEDTTMRSGKFDEELARMSALADMLNPRALILFNESFASTNEREGSDVGAQIVHALLDSDIKVIFVTHLYRLAHAFEESRPSEAIFLRAERQEDGTRTFKLSEGKPLDTSFGEDLYEKIFEETPIQLNPLKDESSKHVA